MKTAFITGATSGIGYEMAKQLSEQGYRLILSGRNEQRLQQLKDTLPGVIETLRFDLSNPEYLEQLIDRLDHIDLEIDVAINNAGFGLHGAQLDLNVQKVRSMMQLNVNTVIELSHYFAERMAQQGHGRILNVASTAAYQPQPFMSAYAASKAFVSSFTEGLAIEMKDKGVSVTVLSPGLTDTGFFNQDGKDISEGGTFSAEKRVSPALVAKLGLSAMFAGKVREIATFQNKALVFLNRILSRNVMLKIYTGAMQKV